MLKLSLPRLVVKPHDRCDMFGEVVVILQKGSRVADSNLFFDHIFQFSPECFLHRLLTIVLVMC